MGTHGLKGMCQTLLTLQENSVVTLTHYVKFLQTKSNLAFCEILNAKTVLPVTASREGISGDEHSWAALMLMQINAFNLPDPVTGIVNRWRRIGDYDHSAFLGLSLPFEGVTPSDGDASRTTKVYPNVKTAKWGIDQWKILLY